VQFSVIRTYCATRFRDPGFVIVADADWKNYVNDVYHEMLTQTDFYPWNEQSTTLTIAGNTGTTYPLTRSVPLPTDVWQVTAIWDITDQFPMIPLEGRAQVYQEYPQQIELGQPMHYRIFNNMIEVYPAPTVTIQYLVEYLQMPADLVNDTDLPIFPAQWHLALAAGAVAKAYKDDGNPNQAQIYDQDYQTQMAALKAWCLQPRQDRYYEPVDTFM
jgi:hypothetical protein